MLLSLHFFELYLSDRLRSNNWLKLLDNDRFLKLYLLDVFHLYLGRNILLVLDVGGSSANIVNGKTLVIIPFFFLSCCLHIEGLSVVEVIKVIKLVN
jgi:hypothetical protein